MLQPARRRPVLVILALVAFTAVIVATFFFTRDESPGDQAAAARFETQQEAPPDLQKLREPYAAGVAALKSGNGADAVAKLGSFDFGPRAVEQYRLYYLARGYEMSGAPVEARHTLATLWRRAPRFVHMDEAASNLARLYAESGDASHSGEIYGSLALRTREGDVAAAARWAAAMERLAAGDASGAFYAARSILIHNPADKEAAEAAQFVRALSGLPDGASLPLTPSERLDRAIALIEGNEAQKALDELTALATSVPARMKPHIDLQRGIALQRLRRYADSNETLEPLTSGAYQVAIPALRYAAKNYSILASAIDPKVTKTVKEKKRVGTIKQRVGKGKKRRTVTKPRYQTVFRKVELVDLAKKKKKDEYERLTSERLKDLLLLPIDAEIRHATLIALIKRAEEKNQAPYLRELVPEAEKLDPLADPALQYFWDRAWAAYERGDLESARTNFDFISRTYQNVNVGRQARYWFARCAERKGQKEEAMAIYRELASAPYVDLYAFHSIKRGASHEPNRTNPLSKKGDDWRELAEKEMPSELQLAYELTALGQMHDATMEIRRNLSRANRRFAESLMAEVHHATGNRLLMYRSLRYAWPQLATVEQDSVPVYFLRMYYPLAHHEEIGEYAAERKLDPNLVRALILQESYYNPEAKSRVGATGLMQLMPPTAAEHARKLRIPFAVSRLENPEVNIRLGTYHLRMLINLFDGNEHLAIAAYNAGQGNVAKWRRAAPRRPLDEFLESIPFQETRNYVKRVTMLRSSYERVSS